MIQGVILYILYGQLNWGFTAILVANSVMFVFRFLIAYALVRFGGRFPIYDDVRLFSSETFANTWPMVKQGL